VFFEKNTGRLEKKFDAQQAVKSLRFLSAQSWSRLFEFLHVPGTSMGATLNNSPTLDARRVLTISQYTERYGRSRTGVFEDIKTGRLVSFKAGRRRLIPLDAAEALLQENIRSAMEASAK
jgi:hypothetical protein